MPGRVMCAGALCLATDPLSHVCATMNKVASGTITACVCFGLAPCLAQGPAPADTAASAPVAQPVAQLETVVVTGTVRAQALHDAPFAIQAIDAGTLRASGPMINLSEAMVRVPGLVVNNRNNYAQDLQISSRGFGARAGFGVRGLRLYTDGIPASMPDGQGQVGHFDLAGAQRIEVLRGPFSVLYGNSSGGVIAAFTAPARSGRSEGALDAGSFGLKQMRASVAAPLGEGWDMQAGGSHVDIEGFRPHSAASRTLASARLGYTSQHNRVVVLAGTQDQPADDPLGLTREQFDADPDQTTSQATQFDTRKTAQQTQVGTRWQHFFRGDGALRESSLMVYAGERSVVQFLAIAPGTQRATATHCGGVIDFDRNYHGVHGHLRFAWDTVDLLAGVELERMVDARRGFENFTGPADAPDALGVVGTLRRDERNTATSSDAFAQAAVQWSEQLQAQFGMRTGRVRMQASDAFLSNGDDSGSLDFSYTNPVAGLTWKLSPRWNLHASAARGFESPTLGELAYRADGSGGLNTALKPQKSRQLELGSKWRGDAVDLDAVLFRADTTDEIGIQTNAGGRQSFRNVGRTQRTGAELAGAWRVNAAWRATLALTWLDATYEDSFLACAGIPCAAPTVPVSAGNQIAGTQKGSAFAELAWRGGGAAPLDAAVEWRAQDRTAVNDVNSDFAAGYGSVNLRLLRQWPLGGQALQQQRIEWLARIDNLLDRRYAGSVVVNDANRRFFEPAAPRSLLLGVRLVTAGW
jgi:iron complex outermembrane receptor protein